MVRYLTVAVAVALLLPDGWPLLLRAGLGVAAAVALSVIEWAAVPSGPVALEWWRKEVGADAAALPEVR